MSETKRYNGWTNYETWAVKLWMDNSLPDYWEEMAKTAHENNSSDRCDALCALSEMLKEAHEESLPEVEGFAADLLNGAMSEVNWYEISEHVMDAACETFDLSFDCVTDAKHEN